MDDEDGREFRSNRRSRSRVRASQDTDEEQPRSYNSRRRGSTRASERSHSRSTQITRDRTSNQPRGRSSCLDRTNKRSRSRSSHKVRDHRSRSICRYSSRRTREQSNYSKTRERTSRPLSRDYARRTRSYSRHGLRSRLSRLPRSRSRRTRCDKSISREHSRYKKGSVSGRTRQVTTPKRSNEQMNVLDNVTMIQLVQALKSLGHSNSDRLHTQNVIPEFDPSQKEQTIEMWLHKVNECAIIYNWNDRQTIHYSLPKLKGLAQKWYEGLSTLLFSWKDDDNYVMITMDNYCPQC